MLKRIAYALVIAMSGFLLWHLSCIWRLGQFYIQEPNRMWLCGEIILMAGVLAFGINMAVRRLNA